MDTQTADFSGQLKDRIAALIGPQRYKIWFKNATQFSLTENFLKVGVPNHFIGGWIERHFSDAISQAARDVLQRDIQLTYALDPALAPRLRKTQLNSQAASVSRHEGANGARPRRAMASRTLRGRFDTFVVGPGNCLAHSTALAIAQGRPEAPHSLFVHGGCGLGKTHLLHGIANAAAELPGADAATQWAYVSGEEFTNEFLWALKSRQLERFRRRYRRLDLLLLDDVHFLANKKATQEEFLHTLNAINTIGKRIVLASDAHPRLIGQLSEALVSRFISGMVVRIEPPDHATRCDILGRRAAEMQNAASAPRLAVPGAVIHYIAERVCSNVRELEGALLRVVAFASMANTPLSLAIARQALEEHANRSEPIVTAEQIETVVATFFGVTPVDLHTSRKTRTIALARAIAMHLARKRTSLSFPEIARLMGNKNHSTVLLACRRIANILAADGDAQWQAAAGIKSMRLSALLKDLEEQFSK